MTSASRATSARLLALALTAPLVLAACSSDPAPTRSRAAGSPSPTTASPTPPPPAPSRLSGRLGRPDGPVWAAKIDNTAKAHPQVGLSKADIVYVEQVEGGVTRLAAVYSSEYPTYVGPVRSGRITDIELLRQFGTVGLIYSGSQRKLADNLGRADLRLVSFDADNTGYTRSPSRPQTYDVVGTFDRLMSRVGAVDPPPEMGWTFGAAPLGGKPAKRFTVSYPGARVSGEWSSAQRRWLLSMDGSPARAAEGGALGPTTFVVQFATVKASNYSDVNGANTPETVTVGKGRAMFFRDGRVFTGSWSRDKATSPTSYLIDGQQAVLAAGQLWVALVGRDRPVTVD